MNRFAKTLAAAALVAGTSSLSAFASSISFASGTDTVTYTNAGGSGTATVVSSAPYPNMVAGSQFISFDPMTQTTGDPKAITKYFLTLIGDYTNAMGSITVGADDITSVFLNGVSLGSTKMPYDTLATFTYTLGAMNTFEFDVNNTNGGPTALDFGGSAATPEPSSLILLGSGLVSAAGMVIRKRRVSA